MRFLIKLVVASACFLPAVAQAGEKWVCQAKCGYYNSTWIVPLAGLAAGEGYSPLEAFETAQRKCTNANKNSFLIKEVALQNDLTWTEATITTICMRYEF